MPTNICLIYAYKSRRIRSPPPRPPPPNSIPVLTLTVKREASNLTLLSPCNMCYIHKANAYEATKPPLLLTSMAATIHLKLSMMLTLTLSTTVSP